MSTENLNTDPEQALEDVLTRLNQCWKIVKPLDFRDADIAQLNKDRAREILRPWFLKKEPLFSQRLVPKLEARIKALEAERDAILTVAAKAMIWLAPYAAQRINRELNEALERCRSPRNERVPTDPEEDVQEKDHGNHDHDDLKHLGDRLRHAEGSDTPPRQIKDDRNDQELQKQVYESSRGDGSK